MELVDLEDEPEVRHRHVVAVDRVVDALVRDWRKMSDDLVSAEVPVDPSVGAATRRAPQRLPVELTRRVEIIDGHRQMKPWSRGICHAGSLTSGSRDRGGATLVGRWSSCAPRPARRRDAAFADAHTSVPTANRR